MNIDINHVEASARRFHKTTSLLAEKASGVSESAMPFHPVIITTEKIIWAITSGKGDSDFYTPYIVNAAFSIEILLKWILYLEKNEWVKGHSLIKLFEQLSNDSKKIANNKFKELLKNNKNYNAIKKSLKKDASIALTWNLATILSMSATSFENWRYAFETKKKSCFLCYGEVHNALTHAKESTC